MAHSKNLINSSYFYTIISSLIPFYENICNSNLINLIAYCMERAKMFRRQANIERIQIWEKRVLNTIKKMPYLKQQVSVNTWKSNKKEAEMKVGRKPVDRHFSLGSLILSCNPGISKILCYFYRCWNWGSGILGKSHTASKKLN